MHDQKMDPEKRNLVRRQRSLVIELAIILVLAFGVWQLQYNYDFLDSVANWVLLSSSQSFSDEIVITGIFLGLAAGVFSFRRWREANFETVERRKVEAVLRTVQGQLETRVQERTADLLKVNASLEAEGAERKQAQEFNRKLVEASPVGIIYMDQDFKITYENPAMQRIAGFPASVQPLMVGRKFFDLPFIKSSLSKELTSSLMSGEAINGKVIHYQSSMGRSIDLEVYTTPLKNERGDFEDTILLAQDIGERKKAEAKIQRQLEHLTILSDIDRAITSSFDLRLNLAMLLTHVLAQLGVDAADVLIFNPTSQMLEYAAGRGFRSNGVEKSQVRMGESYAGRAAIERELVYIPNLKDQPENSLPVAFMDVEEFSSYYAVPLMAKGEVKGVLEVFHRAPLAADHEWLDFLTTLAGQAALAIDNSTLFDNLQRSNTDLALAYDATIEGWSHALDLRDKETEGHTQRVTDLTLRLARRFGVDEKELVQVRWGALLHDIGKMGVPDGILLKAAPLTDEEWVAMRKHPRFAYELLSPIRYLRNALDIPYCHHEKWDGTGYPRGLKGEEIPLMARIFAVVDVWDALTSDRPYRPAWTEARTLQHIQSLSGTHFDPEVVKIILESGELGGQGS
jgi:PAS domain S-box-containing protein/putative nucleotidyltransferase with HDIG domain